MPSITIHPPSTTTSACSSSSSTDDNPNNPLPRLLQTPSGLAIVEIQGTINMPNLGTITTGDEEEEEEDLTARLPSSSSSTTNTTPGSEAGAGAKGTTVGRIVFPLYDANAAATPDAGAWMKRVYLYVGKHQRMTGEVKKLAKPLAVLRRRDGDAGGGGGHGRRGSGEQAMTAEGDAGTTAAGQDVEIAEIVRFKILFASRPEPVGVVEQQEQQQGG